MDALEELRRLEREATEGPWEVDHLGVFKAPPAPHLARKVRICQVSHKRDDVLIAALRNAAPALLKLAEAAELAEEALGVIRDEVAIVPHDGGVYAEIRKVVIHDIVEDWWRKRDAAGLECWKLRDALAKGESHE